MSDDGICSRSEIYVTNTYPQARVLETSSSYYIHDSESGKVLSPMCTGSEPAWRWAEIHIKYFGKLTI